MQTLINRVSTGHWNYAALTPGQLNAAAAGLGPADNIYTSGSSVVATAPEFTRYQVPPYPRPFDLARW